MTDPSTAVAYAMASTRGKRTGVLLGKRGSVPVGNEHGLEDMNKFWESAESPPPEDVETNNTTKPLQERTNKAKNIKPKKRVKPRFSLPNSKDGDTNETSSSKEMNRYLARVVESDSKKARWSPSDLSRVSTAPPTPAVLSGESESPQFGASEADDIPVSPPEEVRASPEEAEEEEHILKESTDHHESRVTTESPPLNGDYDFPEGNADFSDNDHSAPPPVLEGNKVDDGKDAWDGGLTTSPGVVDFPTEVRDDDDDGDKDDADLGVADDLSTPETAPEAQPKKKRKPAQKKSSTKKRNYRPKRSKHKGAFSSPMGLPAGNRDYKVVPVSDYKESPEEGVRRSKRARFPPLDYWRNEKLVYEAHEENGLLGDAMGSMPVVSGVLTALPTPYKKRKVVSNGGTSGRATKLASKSNSSVVEEAPFDARKLRKKYNFKDDGVAHLWDDSLDDSNDMKVVAHLNNMVSTKLPLPKTRRKGEGKVVGEAAQAFNIPTDEDEVYMGYIMGQLTLPPKGIKDHEAVGGCSQTFTVCEAQQNAVEVAYADPHGDDGTFDPDTAQRFLLGPGDMFRVPPGNCYRIQNHSKSTGCYLTWTIIRPRSSGA